MIKSYLASHKQRKQQQRVCVQETEATHGWERYNSRTDVCQFLAKGNLRFRRKLIAPGFGCQESGAPHASAIVIANGAVIGARFGDAERDEAARNALAEAFPGCEIVMLQIDAIAAGGGGVHCLTQRMPTDGTAP